MASCVHRDRLMGIGRMKIGTVHRGFAPSTQSPRISTRTRSASVRTIKESCLDRMILVGEASLRRAVDEFIEHYHGERNHQGLLNQLIVPVEAQTIGDGPILSRERLGGLLKYLPPTRRVTAADVAALDVALAITIRTRPPILLRARPAFAPRAFQISLLRAA